MKWELSKIPLAVESGQCFMRPDTAEQPPRFLASCCIPLHSKDRKPSQREVACMCLFSSTILSSFEQSVKSQVLWMHLINGNMFPCYLILQFSTILFTSGDFSWRTQHIICASVAEYHFCCQQFTVRFICRLWRHSSHGNSTTCTQFWNKIKK